MTLLAEDLIIFLLLEYLLFLFLQILREKTLLYEPFFQFFPRLLLLEILQNFLHLPQILSQLFVNQIYPITLAPSSLANFLTFGLANFVPLDNDVTAGGIIFVLIASSTIGTGFLI